MDDRFDYGTKEPEAGKAKRQPVDYQFNLLNWDFLKAMAQVGHYGAAKYGPFSYIQSRLELDKSPANHIAAHLGAYLQGEKHDHFNDLEHQLAAIAFNAMMEFYYLRKFGPRETPLATENK